MRVCLWREHAKNTWTNGIERGKGAVLQIQLEQHKPQADAKMRIQPVHSRKIFQAALKWVRNMKKENNGNNSNENELREEMQMNKDDEHKLQEFEKMHSKTFMYFLEQYERWQRLKRSVNKDIQNQCD